MVIVKDTLIQRNIKHYQITSEKKLLLSFFVKIEETNTVNAELFLLFPSEQTLPVSDHTGNLFWVMFPDSKTAQKYGCAKGSVQVQYIVGVSKEIVNLLSVDALTESLPKSSFANKSSVILGA